MKKIALIVVIGFVTTLAGCNMMNGLGKDIQKAGEAIEKKSEK